MIPIIIINWNGYNDTVECINSVLQLNYFQYHIFLIDNGSSNDEGKRLASLYETNKEISVHLYQVNHGFTGAHNKIWNEELRELNTEYLILLNNDTVISDSSVNIDSQTCSAHKNTLYALPMIQYNDHSLIDNLGLKLMTSGEILPIDFGKKVNTLPKRNIIGPSGGACVLPTSIIRHIGFFDDFFITGYEDAEFALRATIAGYETVLLQDIVIYHKGGQSLKKIYAPETIIKTQLNILYTIFKLLPPLLLFITVVRMSVYYIGIICISIILLRLTYALSFIKAIYQFFRHDYAKAIIARRKFKSLRKLSSLELMRIQESSIQLILNRLWKYFILRKRSKIDEY